MENEKEIMKLRKIKEVKNKRIENWAIKFKNILCSFLVDFLFFLSLSLSLKSICEWNYLMAHMINAMAHLTTYFLSSQIDCR